MATLSEVSLACSDGTTLAAQKWTQHASQSTQPIATNKSLRILCLHGWMDNCRTFHYLAPRLIQAATEGAKEASSAVDTELICLDFPGHGLSSHTIHPPSQLAETAFYVAEAIKQLSWESAANGDDGFVLIGHSMGAAVASLYAASFPEQVKKLVLLEGAGPLARPAQDIAKHVRQHVKRRQLGLSKAPRIYPSFQKAVETRCATAKAFPGNQYLSQAAAEQMVRRGTKPADGGGVQFIHDPRLQWPSLQYFTTEQTEALFRDIQCPTALLLAEEGWPFDKTRREQTLSLLQPVLHKTLPGSHHFHADPDTQEAVASQVVHFLFK